MDTVKQVIVVRKDLKMRRGKESAQVAHASMCAVFNYFQKLEGVSSVMYKNEIYSNTPLYKWLHGNFTKIVLSCDSLNELFDIETKAKIAGINTCLIKDNGLTEFREPTITCLAIGPEYSNIVDTITGNLPLR